MIRRFGLGPPLLLGLAMLSCIGRGWSPTPRVGVVRWEGLLRDDAVGDVHLVRHGGRPARIVLFITGDGGWDDGAADIAERLAGTGAVVASVDVEAWRQRVARSGRACTNFADALGALAIRMRSEASTNSAPVVLVGHSSGATIAYLALAQAPARRFAGAVSMGFAPVLEFPVAPCAAAPFVVTADGPVAYRLSPTTTAPRGVWWVLQGETDNVTPEAEAKPFVDQVHGAHFVALQGVGHEFAGASSWVPAVVQAMDAADSHRPERGSHPTADGRSERPS